MILLVRPLLRKRRVLLHAHFRQPIDECLTLPVPNSKPNPIKPCGSIYTCNDCNGWQMKSFASMQSNPFSTRFVEAFSDRKDGRLTFEELVDVYSLFHNRASLAEKETLFVLDALS